MTPSVTVRLLATQSDARLVELARQGHERAFEALVQRYRRPLLAYCRRVLLPEARAEDAVQQTLLQAWLALQQGTEVRDVRPWLYRIAHNTAVNALRRSSYDYAELSEALSGADAPQEDLDRRIAVREALAGLAALPEQQREALMRTAVEGASHADAAAEMGLSETAVRGLVYRARSTMRTALTAITPLPLLTWMVGHGGGAGAGAGVAVGGGSAGTAGLLARSAAILVTASAVAAGAGTVVVHTHHRADHATPRPADSARSVELVDAAARHAAATAPVSPAAAGGSRHRGRHRRRHGRGARHGALDPVTPPGAEQLPSDGEDHDGTVHGHGRVRAGGGRGHVGDGVAHRPAGSRGGSRSRAHAGHGHQPKPNGKLPGNAGHGGRQPDSHDGGGGKGASGGTRDTGSGDVGRGRSGGDESRAPGGGS